MLCGLYQFKHIQHSLTDSAGLLGPIVCGEGDERKTEIIAHAAYGEVLKQYLTASILPASGHVTSIFRVLGFSIAVAG